MTVCIGSPGTGCSDDFGVEVGHLRVVTLVIKAYITRLTSNIIYLEKIYIERYSGTINDD
jgi:hypothetical protein